MSKVIAKSSPFQFKKVRFLESHINYQGSETDETLSIGIIPSGKYSKSTKEFILILDLAIKPDNGKDFINIICESTFLFDDDVSEEVPNYFTLNAPAITFPYIRAFINTLTNLSGFGTLDVPILNLVELGQDLKKSIKILE